MIERSELLVSFFIAIILSVVYIAVTVLAEPSTRRLLGFLMGFSGLILMLMTETLYTLRKRAPWFRFGRLRIWLSFHIVTGLVGPWLALLHTGFVFRGVAGLAMALTIVVVLSGFIGRYIYTAVPRTIAGVVLARDNLIAQAAALQTELDRWAATGSDNLRAVVAQYRVVTPQVETTSVGLLTQFFQTWWAKFQMHQALQSLRQVEQRQVNKLEQLLRQRQEVERQMASLRTAQKLLRWWHRIHVPLGLTLFTTIAIHIVATIYFGALAG